MNKPLTNPLYIEILNVFNLTSESSKLYATWLLVDHEGIALS